MKHVLFITTSTHTVGTSNHPAGYEFSEVADPYIEFVNKGFTVDFASIAGGTPPFVGYNPNHSNSRVFKEGSGFRRLNFSHRLNNLDVHAYDAIFFPGGLGPMTDMANNPLVKKVIVQAYEQGKVVGAVCHGSVALLHVQLSDGRYLVADKHITSFTAPEEEKDQHHLGSIIPFLLDEALQNQGGKFSSTIPFEAHVVTDGNLVTGQNPASATGVATKMIQLVTAG